jgi:hypothetical protein
MCLIDEWRIAVVFLVSPFLSFYLRTLRVRPISRCYPHCFRAFWFFSISYVVFCVLTFIRVYFPYLEFC